ncbi:helix-turn-helix domain-containing protein [Paucisalibacillus globulus]|uniref:helix-turn-helix domain-containing protein n=1 Tax=Paucisalibacillus globulus TaxID=351095 RepID=UPI0020D18412|nr:helix-turn-helix transcriptional regulator [Paucisalibacillus globulus]
MVQVGERSGSYMIEFGSRLRNYREKLKETNKKWTQQYVADQIGVARVTYTAYENGTKMPPFDTVNRIAELFDVTTDYLMGRNEDNSKKAIIEKISEEFPDADLMFNDLANMTAEQLEEVYDFIKFKLHKK